MASFFSFLDTVRARIHDWMRAKAHGAHAKWWLFLTAFTESSFLPLPPDFLLITILIAGAHRWHYYAGLTTLGSVLGGIFGYLIGALFFSLFGEMIVSVYHLEEELLYVGERFASNAFLAIFLSAFTPIPYKIFTISAGLFRVSLPVFLLASLVGRGLRFYLVAYSVKIFGVHMGKFLFRYFNVITLLIALGILFLIFVNVV
jgi:membrane protein YqaA with SNARE-associated domain